MAQRYFRLYSLHLQDLLSYLSFYGHLTEGHVYYGMGNIDKLGGSISHQNLPVLSKKVKSQAIIS